MSGTASPDEIGSRPVRGQARMSAGSDAATSIYRRVEFPDIGTARIFGEDDG